VINTASIFKKLAGITKRLNYLADYESLTLAEFLEDEVRQAAIERLLELIIQAAIDINKMLLKQAGIKLRRGDEATSNAEAFVLAGEQGFISQSLATELAESSKFRNVLAHLYDDIVPESVHEAIQFALTQYPQYITEIETYLDSLETENDEEN
jgi:uncharacterized protein YutE (UPF0331/DUF86 family)